MMAFGLTAVSPRYSAGPISVLSVFRKNANSVSYFLLEEKYANDRIALSMTETVLQSSQGLLYSFSPAVHCPTKIFAFGKLFPISYMQSYKRPSAPVYEATSNLGLQMDLHHCTIKRKLNAHEPEKQNDLSET